MIGRFNKLGVYRELLTADIVEGLRDLLLGSPGQYRLQTPRDLNLRWRQLALYAETELRHNLGRLVVVQSRNQGRNHQSEQLGEQRERQAGPRGRRPRRFSAAPPAGQGINGQHGEHQRR